MDSAPILGVAEVMMFSHSDRLIPILVSFNTSKKQVFMRSFRGRAALFSSAVDSLPHSLGTQLCNVLRKVSLIVSLAFVCREESPEETGSH